MAMTSKIPMPAAARRRRRGYILVFVLGITAVVTSLGLAYMSANGTVMQQAVNRYTAVRAQYIAESGVVLARHYLQYPQTAVGYDDYLRSLTGVAIDDTADTVSATVTQDDADTGQYTITAYALVHAPGNTTTVAAKQRVRATLIVPPVKWRLAQALLANTSLSSPAQVTVNGDVHANGNLSGLGPCSGTASATGLATWVSLPLPSAIQSNQKAITVPTITTAGYSTYVVNRQTYSATAYANGNINTSGAAALNATDVSVTNPGRVFVVKSGNFMIQDSVTLNGTFIIDGDLHIEAAPVRIVAQSGFPALVVTGNLIYKDANNSLVVNGAFLCGGSFKDAGALKPNFLTVNGALITGSGFAPKSLLSTITLNWDKARAAFWNFAETSNPKPATLLGWQEQ